MSSLAQSILKTRKQNSNEFFYCKSCLYPSTKPNLFFDQNGVCSACNSFAQRQHIDWDQRENEFHHLLEKYKKPGQYDCIVPGSGGKDSFYQVWLLKKLGYNPLVVTATTDSLSTLGRKNLEAMRSLGVDHLEFTLNPIVRRRINYLQLKHLGDISWPEHVAIWSIPVRTSVQYGIPLLIWGENGQNEYGGPASESDSNVLDRKWVEEFGGLNGFRVIDLLKYSDFKASDLIGYTYPSDVDINRVGSTGLYLGYYFPWDGWRNAFLAEAFGFHTFDTAVQGSAGSYENLDNYQTSIHDYFKYLKYGFGRATDIVSNHIRRGRLTRHEALDIVERQDGIYPSTYLDKSLDYILNEINMSEKEFVEICDKFTNRALFKFDESGRPLKDSTGRPILKFKPQ